ncbi:hypothetical protein J7438_09105 [Thalassotalea sp. G20_0]|uniref:hypothetical protein n=1 Tax=Thalassotalea sp. G20_0 TaxID=2821093 RepID=UPI001ADA8297|nr:hypothetical protein [Thalassotalea sp. G20_0]MBO9494244.1 hypothetical protein [Thalassotalea sp. G20_0]
MPNLHKERLSPPDGERIEGHTDELEWGRAQYEDPDLMTLPDGTPYPSRPSNETVQTQLKGSHINEPLTEHQVNQLNNLDYPYTVENPGDGYGTRAQSGLPTKRKTEAQGDTSAHEGDPPTAERDRGDAGADAEIDASGKQPAIAESAQLSAPEYFGQTHREQVRDGLSNEAFARRKVRDVARAGFDILDLKEYFRTMRSDEAPYELSEALSIYVQLMGSDYSEEQALSFAADYLQNVADASRNLTQQGVVDNSLAEESRAGQVDHGRDTEWMISITPESMTMA